MQVRKCNIWLPFLLFAVMLVDAGVTKELSWDFCYGMVHELCNIPSLVMTLGLVIPQVKIRIEDLRESVTKENL